MKKLPLSFPRLSNPLLSQSFFVFGARGTGKSTLVRQVLSREKVLELNLLEAEVEERYARSPQDLGREVRARLARGRLDWVFIDEVQKQPKLLDEVHAMMEASDTRSVRFALTGSSARKLKLMGANLLAGRAFVNELYPLSFLELGKRFNLDEALNWGTLPRIFALVSELEKQEFLRAYVRNYLKEEVWDERLVQNLDPFRKFLEVAAQASGTILNFSKASQQTGVNDKTIKKYFEILVDTFLGFYLEPYARSVRSQQLMTPKFYLFDLGVKRAMEGLLTVPVAPKTIAYGRAFEHWVICECMRLNRYLRTDFKFSYLKTKDGVEVDLIIERPGRGPVVIEIKSGERIAEDACTSLRRFLKDFESAEWRVWSNDPTPRMFGEILAQYWQDGIREIFDVSDA